MGDSVKHTGSPRRFESVIESIKTMIIMNKLNPGDKLPSERDLADYFNVSRVPIREALKILEYVGVLDGSSGDGMYVRDIDSSDLSNKLKFTYTLTSETMINLVELRIELEAAAAYYAALRRTEDDIAEIRGAIEAMREAKRVPVQSEEQLEELRILSQLFHRRVINAAGNNVLSSVYQNLFELLDISRQFTIGTSGISYDSILAHESICNMIINRDCDGARARMTEHLDTVRRRLSDYTGSAGARNA